VKILKYLPMLALILLAEGCFQYVPVGGTPLDRGSLIRLRLERPASFELTQVTVNDVSIVNGEWVASDAGDMLLSATWLESFNGIGYDGENLTLRIPEANVSTLEAKRFSWWRTGAVLLGGAIGAIATFFGFDALGTGTEGSAWGPERR
jgi:hypothetical protein